MDESQLYELLMRGQLGYSGPGNMRQDFEGFMGGRAPQGGMYSPQDQKDYSLDLPLPPSEGGVPGPNPQPQQAPAGTSPSTGHYEEIVRNYLDELQHPVTLPRPTPLSGMQKLALTLNPDRRGELMQHFREPYNVQMQETQLNLQRRGQAAQVAAGMEQTFYERQRLEQKEAEQADLVHANQGDIYWPYKNPGARQMAELRHQERESLLNARNRTAQPKVPQTSYEYGALIDKQIARLRGQMSITPQNAMAMQTLQQSGLGGQYLKPFGEEMGRMNQEIEALHHERDFVMRMNDDQFRKWFMMPENRRRALAMAAGEDEGGGPQGQAGAAPFYDSGSYDPYANP